MLSLLLATGGLAQETAAVNEKEAQQASSADSVDDATPDKPQQEPQGDAEDVEDSDLDIQGYEKDDDVFVPTEEIPADEAIPFPTNI